MLNYFCRKIFCRASIFAVLFFVSCEHSTGPASNTVEPLPAIDVSWSPQQSLVCFGTSLTNGFLGFDFAGPVYPNAKPLKISAVKNIMYVDTTSYPALLGKQLKIKVVNEGIIGCTTARALNVVGDSVFSKNPALVLLEFGANDFLQEIDVNVAEQQLGRLIDTLLQYGSKVVLVSFLYQEMIATFPADDDLASRKQDAENYLSMLQRVAESYSIPFIENAMNGIYWDPALLSKDNLHPNVQGYKKMEENIYYSLINTFIKNNMATGSP